MISNEILLFLSIFIYFGLLLVFYKFFGKTGLYFWTIIASILANIEVLIMVDAFGMEMTLGNVCFASTFLVTDILSERYDKESANKAVTVGFFSMIAFVIITQSWLLFTPSDSDFAFTSIKTIFSNTPRLALSSVLVYLIVQKIDIIIYHKLWDLTKEKEGNTKKMLWLRNNGSTLISQLLNTVLFTLFAFYGVYSNADLISIMISSYVIFIAISLLDTPFIYVATKIKVNDDFII